MIRPVALVVPLHALLVAGGARMEIKSQAFPQGGPIPARYTCDGKDASPPLSWSGAPAGTKSFALISDDPDAPGRTWVHWVMWNLPATAGELPQGVSTDAQLADGTHQGKNDFGRSG